MGCGFNISSPPLPAEEAEGNGFGCSMRHWARHSSGLFSNVVRHCVDGEKQFEEIIEKLIVSQGRVGPL